MTAADRPSVTDEARAEAVEAIKAHLTDRYVDHDAEEIAWNVLNIAADMWAEQEAAARAEEPLAWCPGCGDRIPTEVIRERGVCSNCYGTTDDPYPAAGRTETTTEDYPDAEGLAALRENAETATTTTADKSVIERAATVITANTDEPMWSAVVIAKEMASCGLLATARTRPTREELAEAIMDSDTVPCDVCDDSRCHYCRADAYRKADAVLALLADQPDPADVWDEAVEKVREQHPACEDPCEMCAEMDDWLTALADNPYRGGS